MIYKIYVILSSLVTIILIQFLQTIICTYSIIYIMYNIIYTIIVCYITCFNFQNVIADLYLKYCSTIFYIQPINSETTRLDFHLYTSTFL